MTPYSMPDPVRPETYPELLREIGNLTSGTAAGTDDYEVERWAFRGLLNAEWPSASSLWRAQGNQYLNETQLRSAERRVVSPARHWLATEGLPGGLSTANILAHLQHHGAPTRLLDFTSDPFTALYFACEEGGGAPVDGQVLAVDVAKLRTFQTDEHSAQYEKNQNYNSGAALDDDWRTMLERSEVLREPFIVQPAVRDARMRAQSGFFLASAVPPDPPEKEFPLVGMYPPRSDKDGGVSPEPPSHHFDDWQYRVVRFIVPAELKQQVRTILGSTFGKSPRDLFPDISGFVRFNDRCRSKS